MSNFDEPTTTITHRSPRSRENVFTHAKDRGPNTTFNSWNARRRKLENRAAREKAERTAATERGMSLLDYRRQLNAAAREQAEALRANPPSMSEAIWRWRRQ